MYPLFLILEDWPFALEEGNPKELCDEHPQVVFSRRFVAFSHPVCG